MRATQLLLAGIISTVLTGFAQAQDCSSAGAPTCDGTCPGGTVCDSASGGLPGCECVAGSVLNVTKLQVKLNFAKPNKDSIKLNGVVPVLDDFSVEGKSVVVNVGGGAKVFTLDAKGKDETADASVALKVKSKGGIVAAQDSKLSVKVKGPLAAQFADENLTDVTVKDEPVTIPVEVTVDTSFYRKVQAQLYSAKQGKSGKTKD